VDMVKEIISTKLELGFDLFCHAEGLKHREVRVEQFWAPEAVASHVSKGVATGLSPRTCGQLRAAKTRIPGRIRLRDRWLQRSACGGLKSVATTTEVARAGTANAGAQQIRPAWPRIVLRPAIADAWCETQAAVNCHRGIDGPPTPFPICRSAHLRAPVLALA